MSNARRVQLANQRTAQRLRRSESFYLLQREVETGGCFQTQRSIHDLFDPFDEQVSLEVEVPNS